MTQILITGANGEVGHGLIRNLAAQGASIIALDLHDMDGELACLCAETYRGDVRDPDLLEEVGRNHRFSTVFHMASLLSASGEANPELAHEVNVNGSFNIFKMARRQAQVRHDRVRVVFTSSIAVYGLREMDDRQRPTRERDYLTPRTMYGINKLYVEQMGRYFSEYYHGHDGEVPIDFRALRFPGLISADTLPSGGTTDFGPEMLHAAAQGNSYASFVAPHTRLPFMVMGDAVRALTMVAAAPRSALRHQVYNVTGFSASAQQIRALILESFPKAEISFEPQADRQAIVDSWPEVVDDGPAREDWGWEPEFGFERAFSDFLVPRVRDRYSS